MPASPDADRQKSSVGSPSGFDAHQAQDATMTLRRVQEGDASAAEALLPMVYDNLRALAGSYFRQQRPDHTLQPTALVHEAFVKLIDQADVRWEDRAHFFAIAAQAMRWILADHARGKKALKRGGDQQRITLSGASDLNGTSEFDLFVLNDVLDRLAALDERHARIVELRFFVGLTVAEVAEVLGCSTSTIESEWRVVRAWLARHLKDE